MKAVIVFMLLFAVAYCHPVKRSASSSESTEVQPVGDQDSKTATVDNVSSEEDDDNDDDSDSDESVEPTIPPIIETTLVPFTDGRGDSIGYQADYKKHIYYVDGNNIEKGPSSYTSYGYDKSKYDIADLKAQKQLLSTGLDQGVGSSGTDFEDMSQQEQKLASTSSASDAVPSEEGDESSQSSEEDTTGATTTDSNSSESSESEETNTTIQPAPVKSKNVITA